jgi:HlyD family secretion protein
VKGTRWGWIGALGVATGAAIVLGFRQQPVPVESARAQRGPMRVTVEEEGKTRLRTRYIVSAPVTGYVRRLRWKAGDTIRGGEAIAVLEPPKAAVLDSRTREQNHARVNAAEAALAVAEARVRTAEGQARITQADLTYWRRQRDRDEALRKSGDIALERFDKTQSEVGRLEATAAAAERSVQAARAEVESARAELATARAALRPTEVTASASGELVTVAAPASGRIIRVIRESEGLLNSGEPLVEIGNANALEVVVEVLSPDAVKIAPGTRVLLSRWGGETPLEARVRVIEPGGFTKLSALGVEEQRVRVVADIISPESEWSRLGDGYRVEAAFVLWESDQALRIPANSIFRHGDDWAVFAIEGGLARRKRVKIDHRNGLLAEIESGLNEGDEVVAHPDDTVKDGVPVAISR